MAKANITEYDSTAGNNTVINDIDISEGCSPSTINNAIRELMAHLKNVDTGTQALTALSVTGNVSVGGTFTSRGIDDNADALAITIDNSENVFVTKTSSDVAVVGQELRSSGFFASTRDGATVSALTRLSSDGTILEFRKDSSAVGKIGSISDNIFLANNTTGGLKFGTSGGSTIVDPTNETGAVEDATHDLGSSGGRWRNLYLSGGVFLGGTGSANQLDSYEEGTFTAEVRGASARASTPVTGQAHYTKVGNKVTVRMYFVNVNTTGASGTFQITGFPFSATSLQIIQFMSFGQDYDDSGGVMNVQLYLEGGTTAQLIATKDNSAWQTTGITAGSGKYYAFTGTYLTS